MDRVQAQAVDVVLVQPVKRVVDEEPPHLVAIATVEVQRIAPGRAVVVREVRAVIAEVVPLRTEVVVDDVQDQGEALGMAGVDEALEPLGPAIRVVGGEEVGAVVAPVARARKGRHRHQLDGGDAQLAQVRQPRGDARERPLGRERAHVQLVDDQVGARQAAPGGVGPGEAVGGHDARRPVHALRLMARHRIGTSPDVRQQVDVVAAHRRQRPVDARGEHAARVAGHRHLRAGPPRPVEEAHRERLPPRGPHAEGHGAARADVRSPFQPPSHARHDKDAGALLQFSRRRI